MNQGIAADRIEIVCGNAAEYPFEPHTFDAAVCIGPSALPGSLPELISYDAVIFVNLPRAAAGYSEDAGAIVLFEARRQRAAQGTLLRKSE